MRAIQAVLFDLGGTLLHYDQPPDHSIEALNFMALRAFVREAMAAGATVRDPEMAVRAVGRVIAAMEAKAARTNHANTVENAIREGLEAVGVLIGESAWDAGIAAFYATISAAVRPVDGDVRAVLSGLTDQGRLLGIVSNTMWSPEMHDADLARLGLLEFLPVRVYSYSEGLVKPHPSIYRMALDQMDMAPAEAVFVGDRLLVDVAGPQKIGMRTALVTSPYRNEEDPEIRPDARINNLEELPALLDSWDQAFAEQIP